MIWPNTVTCKFIPNLIAIRTIKFRGKNVFTMSSDQVSHEKPHCMRRTHPDLHASFAFTSPLLHLKRNGKLKKINCPYSIWRLYIKILRVIILRFQISEMYTSCVYHYSFCRAIFPTGISVATNNIFSHYLFLLCNITNILIKRRCQVDYYEIAGRETRRMPER